MIQDLTDQYIAAILSCCDLDGREVLETGCGKGRITRDLAKHAGRVVAIDPDAAAIETARSSIAAANVTFLHAPAGMAEFPAASFDVVIYTLSLHHVPEEMMAASLRRASGLLRRDGVIVVIEPADGGSFTEAKERFGAGSGDERPARKAAIRAMHALEGWTVAETKHFRVLFRFEDDEDFFNSMLPDFLQLPQSFLDEVQAFLGADHNGITLDAGRRLDLLRKTADRAGT